jgi:hypothetical protein
MSRLRQEQIAAASSLAETALQQLHTVPSMTAETLVLASARMAGTFLFRSYAHVLNPAAPGTVLLSQVANESGPDLVGLLENALGRLGLVIDAAHVDLKTSNAAIPQLDFLESQRLLEPALQSVRTSFGLDLKETAYAMAIATAILIKHSEKNLKPQAAFGLAVYGFIEGTKTTPAPV